MPNFIIFNNSVLWTIGSVSTDNSLPVQLVSFNASIKSSGISLNWKTESEINNLGFEIWRKSSFDENFIMLSAFSNNPDLKGLGNSSIGNNYSFLDSDVLAGLTYTYRLVDVSFTGQNFFHNEIGLDYVADGLVRVEDEKLPDNLYLNQNYPNPFNNSTRINFSVPGDMSGETMKLIIFNELGQKVKSLFNGSLAEGNYSLVWDGKNDRNEDVTSGMYIYLLYSEKNSVIKRMTLIK